MKSATKKFLAFIMLLTIVVGIIPTNLINATDQYLSGDGWEKNNDGSFIFYNNRITGSALIEIFNIFMEDKTNSFKFAYVDPDVEGKPWKDFGIEVDKNTVYDIEFNKPDYSRIFFAPEVEWKTQNFYVIRVNKYVAPTTEPTVSRNPAIIDNLQDKNFGKFDTEAEFMNAVKNRISASWANSEGSGKVDPSNIKVEFALNDSSVNGNGETVRSYTVTVNITEGTNWLASEQKTVFEEVYWTVNQYVITFDSNGGTEVASIKADCGAPVTIPASPTRDGYEFRGWDLVIDCGVGDGYQDDVIPQMGSKNITYVAIWRAKQFTVQFFDEKGYPIVALTLDYGDVIDVIDISEVTVPTGYTFIGWDLKKNGEYDGIPDAVSKTMGAENLEYQALFKVNQYTISFDTNGGSEIAPITQDFGTRVTLPERPTRIGYTFKGWDKEFPNEMPAKNLTLTARWEVNQYTLTFDTDGGTQIEPITLDYGANLTLPADPKKEHYVFAGWDIEIPTTMPAENITAKALWTPLDYTITFDTSGGSSIDPITKGYGEAVDIPTNPVKSGYNFIGWDKSIPSTMPGENITITALWEEATQKVSFDPNGGVWEDGSHDVKIETVSVNYNIENHSTPKLAGYDFIEWGVVDPVVSGADISYKAIWNLGKTVMFKDGDNVYTQNYAVGEEVVIPQLDEKLGYTFVGWDKVGPNGVGDGFKDNVISVMGSESIVYVAIWEANTYTVIFYNENDEIIEAVTEKYGNPFDISIPPIKTGYEFVGWDLKKNGEYDGIADTVAETMGAENLEYRELFAIGKYTITFDSAGGSAVENITQSYGTDVIPPEHPTKEGYVFEGWDMGVPLTMPAKNITLTARWKKATYTICWDINGDGIINDYDIVTTVEYGDIPKLPDAEIPTKDSTVEFSYLFNNTWSPAIKSADSDATYTAQFDAVRRKYTVKFLNYDGVELQSSEVEYGSTPIYSGLTPTRYDDTQYEYTFAGWSPNIEIVTGAAEYRAEFDESIKKYTVIWQNWDGSILETDVEVEHGSLPTYDGKIPSRPSTVEKTYVFDGWDPQISGVTSNITYVASFTEKTNKYTVTWKNDDGSVIDITEVEYGKIPVHAAPTKPSTPEYSYVFIGWTPSPVAVTDDATYTASYTAEKNKYSVIWNLGGVKTTEIYEYGAMPTFKGSTDKAAEGCTVFSFDCWDKAIESVTGNIEYTAKYSTMTVHTSDEIVFSDVNKKTHDEYFACCNAARADNVAHTFVDEKCICGANEVVTVTVMISDGVFKTIEASPNTELSIDDISVPTPTKGYVFTGWYTADGVRVEGDLKLTNDLAIYAKFFAGDVDGSGKIEKSDVVALNRYIVGDDVITVDDKNALDVNADGKITVADSVILMLYMAGKYS